MIGDYDSKFLRFEEILKDLKSQNIKQMIIFSFFKRTLSYLEDKLINKKFSVGKIDGDMAVEERFKKIKSFKNGDFDILLSSEIGSEGLDMQSCSVVINYDLPNSSEVYTHRIGRTARAGKSGRAVSLVNSNDMGMFEDLKEEQELEQELQPLSVLECDTKYKFTSKWTTLFINGGKKQKLRAGDILGALTAGVGLSKDAVGKINSLDFCSFVAIESQMAQKALDGLSNSRIKGKYFKIYMK